MKSEHAAPCPSCKSKQTNFIGRIPASNIFAGRTLADPLESGYLFHCNSCSLSFRYPQLSKTQLDLLYQQGEGDNWMGPPEKRRDWAIASTWVRHDHKKNGYRVLDVGCYDGGFLDSLGDEVHLHGIEISKEAAKRAEGKGVDILGHDFHDLKRYPEGFDAVVAMDVIEHVQDPLEFLNGLSAAVKTDGIVIFSTGNTHACSWRFMGSRYYYCTNAEHISFVNPEWCKKAAKSCGLKFERMIKFAHRQEGFVDSTKQLALNVAYRLFPGIWRFLRRSGYGGHNARATPSLADFPPNWGAARDHFICCFRKNTATPNLKIG